MLPTAQVFPNPPIAVPAQPRTAPAVTAPTGTADDRILRAIGRYHFLTATQVTRLLYRPGSKRDVEKRLAGLVKRGYLLALPGYSQRGRPPAIYTLDRQGRGYVEGLGIPVRARFRPAELRALKFPFHDHTLALNDVLIALERLAARLPDRLWLEEVRHEQLLRERPLTVALGDGRTAGVVPDAWLDLRFPRPDRRPLRECWWLELDRGTEGQRDFREKVANLIAATVAGAYQDAFGTDLLTVAVVTVPERNPAQRREQLLRWIEQELGRLGLTDQADLFSVTSQDAARVDPAAMFLAPTWYVPFGTEPLPLLEPPGVGGG
jgi:hypothetical protein